MTEKTHITKHPVGCKQLDALLGGGVESATITEFYGEAGSGKTNICLQLTRNICNDGKMVAYIDSEGVSIDRLKQIAGENFRFENVCFFKPYSLEEQEKNVRNAIKLPRLGLIVVDTFNMFLRLRYHEEPDGCDLPVLRMLEHLHVAAHKLDIPVVVTAQVYMSLKDNEIKPFGGKNLEHIAKTIVRLEKLSSNKRRAVLIKHRSLPEGTTAEFVIMDRGIE